MSTPEDTKPFEGTGPDPKANKPEDTESFQVVHITEGTGPKPTIDKKVKMEYTGWLIDTSKPDNKGNKFDSNEGKTGLFEFRIGAGKVIRGWDEGIPQMKVGGEAMIYIHSSYGYGKDGFPGHIPPNANLMFRVKLVEME